ncbi:hypothetical protein I3843_04G139600 [Carya illinoinensis]|nr:hypothetical protein I3843_04G139600 [Carya illinoinensis]
MVWASNDVYSKVMSPKRSGCVCGLGQPLQGKLVNIHFQFLSKKMVYPTLGENQIENAEEDEKEKEEENGVDED